MGIRDKVKLRTPVGVQKYIIFLLSSKCYTSFGAGCAGGKVPIPHALHPFLSTSDVDKRVAKEFGLIGLGGPCH